MVTLLNETGNLLFEGFVFSGVHEPQVAVGYEERDGRRSATSGSGTEEKGSRSETVETDLRSRDRMTSES